LGVPFAIYTLVVWPLLEFALLEPFLHRGSYWRWFSDTDPVLDNGPMWFVGVLLLYSLGLVAWRRWRPAMPSPSRQITVRKLAALSLAVGVTTFLVRLVYPADSNQVLNSHLWAWPEYLAMFGLGVAVARRGWLRAVPRAVAHKAGIATLVVMVLLPAAVLSTEPLGLTEDAWYGGWGLSALLAAMLEGVIALAAPIWILAYAQRHLTGTGPLRRAMARGSYAAFMLQGPVLIALELGFRNLDLTGDLKALLVGLLGITGSFALAWPSCPRCAECLGPKLRDDALQVVAHVAPPPHHRGTDGAILPAARRHRSPTLDPQAVGVRGGACRRSPPPDENDRREVRGTSASCGGSPARGLRRGHRPRCPPRRHR
jgi:hypothetical protein